MTPEQRWRKRWSPCNTNWIAVVAGRVKTAIKARWARRKRHGVKRGKI